MSLRPIIMFFVATVYYTVVLGAGLRVIRMKKSRTYLLQWNQERICSEANRGFLYEKGNMVYSALKDED